MTEALPRISGVVAASPLTLVVTWRDGRKDRIALDGWIGTGGDLLAPLSDWSAFSAPQVINYGTAVSWGDSNDLAIDAVHLRMIADDQKPFSGEDAANWQKQLGLSNNEAADLLGVALSTWHKYKEVGSVIPLAVVRLCRAALRDPMIMQAHYRPRRTGRPRVVPSPSPP